MNLKNLEDFKSSVQLGSASFDLNIEWSGVFLYGSS
jgi:hypothetical protein